MTASDTFFFFMMVGVDANGLCLAAVIANGFVAISNNITFPMLTFLSAGIINFFVPSGGGQWAVQAPIVIPAAKMMGIEYGRAAMGIAWGDQWTNMKQIQDDLEKRRTNYRELNDYQAALRTEPKGAPHAG